MRNRTSPAPSTPPPSTHRQEKQCSDLLHLLYNLKPLLEVAELYGKMNNGVNETCATVQTLPYNDMEFKNPNKNKHSQSTREFIHIVQIVRINLKVTRKLLASH